MARNPSSSSMRLVTSSTGKRSPQPLHQFGGRAVGPLERPKHRERRIVHAEDRRARHQVEERRAVRLEGVELPRSEETRGCRRGAGRGGRRGRRGPVGARGRPVCSLGGCSSNRCRGRGAHRQTARRSDAGCAHLGLPSHSGIRSRGSASAPVRACRGIRARTRTHVGSRVEKEVERDGDDQVGARPQGTVAVVVLRQRGHHPHVADVVAVSVAVRVGAVGGGHEEPGPGLSSQRTRCRCRRRSPRTPRGSSRPRPAPVPDRRRSWDARRVRRRRRPPRTAGTPFGKTMPPTRAMPVRGSTWMRSMPSWTITAPARLAPPTKTSRPPGTASGASVTLRAISSEEALTTLLTVSPGPRSTSPGPTPSANPAPKMRTSRSPPPSWRARGCTPATTGEPARRVRRTSMPISS